MECFLQSLVLFATCLGGIYAIQCYSCSYTNVIPSYNPFCDVTFNSASVGAAAAVVDCDGICRKSSGEILGILGVERKCDNNRTVSSCSNGCGTVEGTDISGCEHCCDTDLCNSACSVSFNLLVSTAMLTLALAFTV